jgi:hypothetical protein
MLRVKTPGPVVVHRFDVAEDLFIHTVGRRPRLGAVFTSTLAGKRFGG